MTPPDLIPELDDYCDRFRAAWHEADRLLETCTAATFIAQPAPGRWSAAQCLDHLNTMGQKVHRQIEAAIAEAREAGPYSKGPFRYGVLDRIFVWSMQPDPWIRVPSPASYAPRQTDLDPEEVVATFGALQDRLITSAQQANGLDLKRIKVASPVSQWMRFSLGAWLAAVAAHQERHLKQAREALHSARRAEA